MLNYRRLYSSGSQSVGSTIFYVGKLGVGGQNLLQFLENKNILAAGYKKLMQSPQGTKQYLSDSAFALQWWCV